MATKHLQMSLPTLSACFAASLCVTGAAQAAEPALEPVPEPPVIPERVQSGEVLEPEVTIIQREDVTIHEYRLNGRLYAVRIFPENAPPYYLVDADGDGELETRRKELTPEILIPQWVLFSW